MIVTQIIVPGILLITLAALIPAIDKLTNDAARVTMEHTQMEVVQLIQITKNKTQRMERKIIRLVSASPSMEGSGTTQLVNVIVAMNNMGMM
jgi:hypothetical protein